MSDPNNPLYIPPASAISNASSEESNVTKKRGRPPKNKETSSTTTSFIPPAVKLDKEEAWGDVATRLRPNNPKSPETPKIQSTDEEAKLIQTIVKYYRAFPKITHNPDIVPGVSVQKLKEELDRIKKELNTVSSEQFFISMDILLMNFIENQGVKRQLPLHGLTIYSKMNQELVEDELKELNILYGGDIVLHPFMKYLYKVGERFRTVVSNNMGGANFNPNQNIDNDILNKYKNL